MSLTQPGDDESAEKTPLAFQTSWRGMDLRESLMLAETAKSFAGISRVARIDGLTEINVPVFSISRPLAKASVTVNSGKGVTIDESRASGLFEAIEVAAAEQKLDPRLFTEADLKTQPHLGLASLCAPPSKKSFPWVQATDFETGVRTWVPECAVSLIGENPAFAPDTNGLASGTSYLEAVFHGLLEVIERHGYSLALVHARGTSVTLEHVVDPFMTSLNTLLSSLGMKIEVKDISEFTGIPTYYALIYNPAEQDSHLVSGGLGCHLDPLIALRRAVTEALQARAVAISGAREDITETRRDRGPEFQESRRIFNFWFEPTKEKAPVPHAIGPRLFAEAIARVLKIARAVDPDLGRMLVFEYPAPKGIFVTRVILENCESFGLIRERVGRKVAAVYAALEAGE